MATPFATHTDYATRGYTSPYTDQVLDARLAAASRFLRAQCADVDDRLAADPPTLDVELVVDIVCAMVHRSIPADGLAGVDSVQQSAGPFSESRRLVNPSGDFYLTKSERRSLGCGGQRAFSVPLGEWAEIP